MAYRGILNDQMVREQETRRKLESESTAFFSAVEERLSRFLLAGTPRDEPAGREESPVRVRFTIDSSGSAHLISHRLLYVPENLRRTPSAGHRAFRELDAASALEFNENKPAAALEIYKARAARSTAHPEVDEALVAMARVYRKLGQQQNANEIYSEIRDLHAGCLFKGQFPLGLTADLELMRIHAQESDSAGLLQDARHLLGLLLKPACEYEESQFGLFFQSLQALVPGGNPVTDSLLREVARQKAITDYLVRIVNDPGLVPEPTGGYKPATGAGSLIIPLQAAGRELVMVKGSPAAGGQSFAIIDFPVFMKAELAGLVNGINPDSTVNYRVCNAAGLPEFERIRFKKNGFQVFEFPENLPRWTLMLEGRSSGFLTALFTAGRGIYLAIFVLITLVMVFGLIFTVFTLNQEMRLNKLKSEFISNVSHELKSPLTSIRQMTEMLDQERVTSESRKKEYYTVMLEQSEHLSHLIDNILDFSRIEDGRKKYRFETCDLSALMSKFVENARERFSESGMEIRYSNPDTVPPVYLDKDAILQVVYNLVDNAVKYSGNSRLVEVSLLKTAEEVQISVKDHGIGIPHGEQDKIFERFYRCEEAQALGIKGSGIGLTIVRPIVEAHNGKLTLESSPGKGTVFTVHIPIIETGVS
jgi:signal transduction histidine kinase